MLESDNNLNDSRLMNVYLDVVSKMVNKEIIQDGTYKLLTQLTEEEKKKFNNIYS